MTTKDTAKDAFQRLRTRVEPRLANLQDRIAPLSQQLQQQLPNLTRSGPVGVQAGVHSIPLPPSRNSREGRRSVEEQRPGSAGSITRSKEGGNEKRVSAGDSKSGGDGAGDNTGDTDGKRDKTDRAPLLPLRPITRATALSWSPSLHTLASKILFRSGQCPISRGPLLILNAAAFPDATDIDYNLLLPYVLANLPSDAELEGAEGYSVVMFAGGGSAAVGSGGSVAGRPSWAWTLQAYHLLGRAVRKKIRRLWVVHEKAWVRVLFEMMAGVVSGKFRKKVVHVATLSDLAKQLTIQHLLIPPSAYIHNRKLEPAIILPTFPPPPVFGRPPFPTPRFGDPHPLPDVLTDATAYLRTPASLSTEGLFRIPASQTYLDILRDAYDRRQAVRWEDWGPHSAAAVIKLYYRLLPVPIIPTEFYEQLPDGSSEEEDRRRAWRLLKETLPVESRVLLLRHLIPLLALVAEKEEVNKMSAGNLAVCVAGGLVRGEDVRRDAEAGEGVRRLVELAVREVEELRPRLPLRREVEGGEGMKRKPGPVPAAASVDPVVRVKKEDTDPAKEVEKAEDAARRPSLPVSPSPVVVISQSQPAPPPPPPPAPVVVQQDQIPPSPTTTASVSPGTMSRRPSLQPPRHPPQLKRKTSVPALPVTIAPDPNHPGTFVRPQLRRVASANLEVKKREERRGSFPGVETLRPVGLRRGSAASGGGLGSLPERGDGEGSVGGGANGAVEKGIRRVRSAGVRELSLLYEERARSIKALETMKKP
ncbi:hypothetical protein EX30DRAFT_56564 [Ascodesmis nigricans]|uniref:Rho-GAP domain-containing protein n=1 Tax=Ascodesmis nigricans TaxID=341454 RepID=A0A4V3SII9_9PEZI|nr:hypothetical protein EX30DRAFT_56564 [Ascodesmis nigricans]